MRKQAGFTLIELMVVIAILGILAATAIPFYQTFRQRAFGAQALSIMRGLVDAQIMYNLQYPENQFFPPLGEDDIIIPYEGDGLPNPPNAIEAIQQALNVRISQSKQFEYSIFNTPEGVHIHIRSPMPLFKGQGAGGGYLMALVDRQGRVSYAGP
jgi:prepilin-type N-terminal cleavage/methylation domain-containing protein